MCVRLCMYTHHMSTGCIIADFVSATVFLVNLKLAFPLAKIFRQSPKRRILSSYHINFYPSGKRRPLILLQNS